MKRSAFFFNFMRLLLVVLFVYTGTSKLISHQLFLQQLSKIPLVGNYAVAISWFIPITEIITAGLFVFPKTEIPAWWMAATLMSIFSTYIALMISFAPHLPCSCGGIISALSWKQHLVVNIMLTLAAWVRLYQYYFIQKFSMHTRE